MKEKMTPHIIAAGALVVFIVLGLACASVPPAAPIIVKTYEMQKMSAADTLKGKSAVVFKLAMAAKILPKQAVTRSSGGGGLVGAVLAGGANLIDFNNFKESITSESYLRQQQDILDRRQKVFLETFSARYAELNGAKTTDVAFNFSGVPTADYFSKANTEIKSKIAEICKENNTDFAITMVGQQVYSETMYTDPISASSTINVEVCLFDKTGTLIAQGQIETVQSTAGTTGDAKNFRVLLDDAFENIVLMLPALGGNGEKSGKKEFVLPPPDTGDTREAGPDETVLVIRRIDKFVGWQTNIVIDKGSDGERSIYLIPKKEIRVVIPNGTHTVDAEIPEGTKEKNDPLTITASGTPITYTLSVKGTMGQGNLKDNERFTWKQVNK
ncbi:hypothetical protein [Treponema sp. R80B11-R83G3]